jgi:hypothetical protein
VARYASREAERLRHHLEAAVIAAAVLRRILDQHRGGVGEFTADGDALDQPCDHHEQGRRDADRRIGRQQTDHPGADRHHDDHQRQRSLAPQPIGIEPEQDAAQGTHRKGDRECRKGQQQRGDLAAGRKEQL